MKLRVLFLAVILTGCASTYGPAGYGGGYSETPRGDNIYVVRFEGNVYTKPAQAEEMAMLRAAELALSKGYRYFTVLDESTRTTSSTMLMPGNSTTTGRMDSFGTFRAQTITGPGYAIPMNSPTARILVGLAHDTGLAGYSWIDASKFLAEVGPKYNLKR